ncbi:MAG: rhomboid family intramembrane serine protease [Mucinivorans sp.]
MNNFQFKSVVSNLIMLNVVFFLITWLLPQYLPWIDQNLALWYWQAPNFSPIQFVSYMFLHANFSHIFFNMFALWMFGRQLEYDMGSRRFLTYYLITGIGAGVLNLLVMQLTGDYGVTIGASGAVFGVLLAFGLLHPNERLLLLIPPVPIKAKYFVMAYGALELFQGVAMSDNIAHFAHLGGMFFGAALLYYWRAKRKINF